MAKLFRIRELCDSKNIQQKELAKRVGITSQAIIDMINRNSTKTDILEKIAKALEVPISYFFDENNNGIIITGQVHTGVGDNKMNTIEDKNKEIEHLRLLLKEKERTIKILMKNNNL